MKQNQLDVLKVIAASEGLPLAEQYASQDLYSKNQFYALIGSLKRDGFLEKAKNGGYVLAEAGRDEMEFDAPKAPEAPKVVEGELMKAEVDQVKIQPALPGIDGECTVAKEVVKEVQAEIVQEVVNETVAEVKPKKTPAITDEEVAKIHEAFLARLNVNKDFVRKLETKGGWQATRLTKNTNRIKALETFRKGHHRVYLGNITPELLQSFSVIATGIKTSKGGDTHYADFEFTSDNLDNISTLLGEVVNA